MLNLRPLSPAELLTRAKQALSKNEWDKAKTDLNKILTQRPMHAETLFLLSRVSFELCDETACLAQLDAATQAAPNSVALWLAYAERLGHFGKADDALRVFDRAIKLAPKDVKPQADKAQYLQVLGHFEDAEALFRKLLKKHPDETELYRIFLGTKKLKPGDPILRQMTRLWNHPRLNDQGRMQIGFALAKGLEDSGKPEKAFGILAKANAAQQRIAPLPNGSRDADWQIMTRGQDLAQFTPSEKATDLTPVFVCGMPRSGTTLVEQIIASHSQATAGGELRHALAEAWSMFVKGTKMQPMSEMTEAQLGGWRDRYLALASRDTGAKRGVITDKAITSHLIFGLIRHALPGAKLIVVHRDPRDIALSIFKNHFPLGTHRYANTLPDIAEAIKLFRHSVTHWKSRLPGVIHEVRYEDLVTDPEPQARALIEAAGLDWEDQCLDFHNSKAEVKTLSLAQVRQPIHAGRRAAWKKYETEMQPFIEAWGDTPWD